MASLQWVALGAVVAIEALLMLLLSFPLHRKVRVWLIPGLRPILQPMLAVIPFSLFQLLEVYWKYENKVHSVGPNAFTARDRDRYEKSMYKYQRNLVLALSAAYLYWLLWRWFTVATHELLLEQEVKKLKEHAEPAPQQGPPMAAKVAAQ